MLWLFNIFDLFLSPWIRIWNPDPDTEDPWIRVRFRIRNTASKQLNSESALEHQRELWII